MTNLPCNAVRGLECIKMAAGGTEVENKVQAKDFAPVDPLSIRNVALVGHSHSGKSALAEWMLFDEKILTKRPQAGESVLDFDPAESVRHSSVFSHFLRVEHAGHLLEITDTPWGDFQSDANAATNGCDSAVIVASAVDGVQAGTISAFKFCQENGIKCILTLSKMDRPFLKDNLLSEFESSLGTKPVPLQVALKDGDVFKGVQPLFTLSAGEVERNNIDGTEEAWMELEEAVAMTDDDLLMEYLDDGSLASEKVINGLRNAIRQNKLLPLVYTSAEQNIGVMELMDTISGFLPNPVEIREDALQAACESDQGKCSMALKPGIEAGFAARVIHTTVDSFGSLSILRIISNSCEGGKFDYVPHNVVNLRNGDSFKVGLTVFTLQGKERVALPNGAQVLPGNIIAVPKLPDSVQTNDILTAPEAVSEEESEIVIEEAINVLTPLSRQPRAVPLMYSALVSLPESGGKKGGKGKGVNSGDDKLISALAAISREDTAVILEQHEGVLLLHCMSSDHAQLVASRVKDRYGIEFELGMPPIRYKETIVRPIGKVEGRHKKQSGGSGQFGVCVIDMEPLEEGSGVEFESRIKGGVISKPFIASVEKGVREQLQNGGPLAGYPVTDVRVILTDGKMHSVDSNDFAFTSAGKLAIKNALSKGGTRLLQPVERVKFTINEELQGEINSIVSRNDGYVTGTAGLDMVEIDAYLPSASIPSVSDSLRAKTGGSGEFTSEFSHYQAIVDDHTVKTVVEQSPHRHE